jgi:hypothetical protein
MTCAIGTDKLSMTRLYIARKYVGHVSPCPRNAQICTNTLEANFGGINAAHDNTVVVGTQSYACASGLSATSSCTSTQLAAVSEWFEN